MGPVGSAAINVNAMAFLFKSEPYPLSRLVTRNHVSAVCTKLRRTSIISGLLNTSSTPFHWDFNASYVFLSYIVRSSEKNQVRCPDLFSSQIASRSAVLVVQGTTPSKKGHALRLTSMAIPYTRDKLVQSKPRAYLDRTLRKTSFLK